MKENNPKFYSIILLVNLIIIAWIGNLVNNLFLTYLGCLFLMLYPGMKKHGLIEKYTGEFRKKISDFIASKTKKDN